MKVNDISGYKNGHIHFIGCGGAGMVGLTQITHELGFSVSGSDMAKSRNTDLLKSLGIPVYIGHSPENIPDHSKLLIVRSSAVTEKNIEFASALERGADTLRRGEMLAKIAELYDYTVAVTGTHGKTSVTALIVHILKSAGINPGFMIGGRVNNWDSSASAGDGKIFITESDESDGTQIHLKSNLLVITNIEEDHTWSVGGSDRLMQNFAKIAENSEQIVCNRMDDIAKFANPKTMSVSVAKFADDQFCEVRKWGYFQKENANIAAHASIKLGVPRETAFCEVCKFPGVERRMTEHLATSKIILIEDYAHHPTEIKAAISTLRQRFPSYRLKIIFQPHRYARLAAFINEFACELCKADSVIVVPVFAAWTETGPVNSENLKEKIGKKAVSIDASWPEIAKYAVVDIQTPEVIAVLGAGDVNQVIPEIIDHLQ